EVAPEPKPARFSVSNLKITPSVDEDDSSYTATVDIQNTGDLRGSYSLVSKVDGDKMDSIKLDLNPGQKKTVVLPEAQACVTSMADQYKNMEITDRTCKVTVGFTNKEVTFPRLKYMLQAFAIDAINYANTELIVSGSIKNIGGTTLNDVEAVAVFLDSNSKLLEEGHNDIMRNPFEPDQISGFEVVTAVLAQNVARYYVYFRYKSGERIPTDYSQ
ncbi:FxLYD domain-containing protein, partial [Chloroflexota bacterium]